jgi:hypothetical protein
MRIELMEKLNIPNENLLDKKIDESKQTNVFKAILAQDINVCIDRVNQEAKVFRDEKDIVFFRSLLRLVRRVSEQEEFEFIEKTDSEEQSGSSLH